MSIARKLRRLGWAAGIVLSSVASASAATVTFNVNVQALLNCQSPLELEEVPLSFEGTMLLKGDGTAVGRLKMTAYYLLSFRSVFGGKLGAPPSAVPDVPGATIQLRVLDKSGLSLKIGLPNNDVTVNTTVSDNSEKCFAEFIPSLKPGKKQHMIYAGDTYYYCDTFVVQGTRCRVQ